MKRTLLTLAAAVLSATAVVAAEMTGGRSTQLWPLATVVMAAIAGGIALAQAATGLGLVRGLAWHRSRAKIARFAESRHQCWRLCRSEAVRLMQGSSVKVQRFSTSRRQCWRMRS